MANPRKDTWAVQTLNFDVGLREKERKWLSLELLNEISEQLSERADELGEKRNLNPWLAKLWLMNQLAEMTKTAVHLTAGEAFAHGASFANIARAVNKSTSNIRRDFPQVDDIAAAQEQANSSGKDISITIDDWTFNVSPEPALEA
jgi:hypothetical protein